MHHLEITTFLLSSRLQERSCSPLPAIVSPPCKHKLSSFLMCLCSSTLILPQVFSTFLLTVPPTIPLVFAKTHSFVCILRLMLVNHTYFHTSQASISISNTFMLCSPSYSPHTYLTILLIPSLPDFPASHAVGWSWKCHHCTVLGTRGHNHWEPRSKDSLKQHCSVKPVGQFPDSFQNMIVFAY